VISAVEADALAAELLGDLRTRLGGLHIAHARRVAAGIGELGDERLVVAALLHDVVEKDRISIGDLSVRVQNAVVIDLVEVLTHGSNVTDLEYLSRCAAHPQALLIKRLDLLDKVNGDDSDVPADVAEQIRRRAIDRLAMLDRLATGTVIPPHRG
jgi:(p)ppGpp synthase/HD superfamily hydrolase